MSEKSATKQRIMSVAKQLFAKKGFEGTSIREIAKKSEVNLAAINYHFKSKKELYITIMEESFHWLEQGIERVCGESKDPRDFTKNLFLYLSTDRSYLLSTAKLLLSDGEIDEDMTFHTGTNESLPAQHHLVRFFSKYANISEISAFWVASSIYATTIHMAVTSTTKVFRQRHPNHKTASADWFLPQLIELSDAVIAHARAHDKKICQKMHI